MISEQEQTQLQKQLEDAQHKLINQLKKHDPVSQKDAVGELSSYDNHLGDMGTELYEREKDATLENHAEAQLEKINEALYAIDEGTYGLCETCSEPIPYERLEMIPEASTCVEHSVEIGADSIQLRRENDGETMYRTTDALYDMDFDETAEGLSDDVSPHIEAIQDDDVTGDVFL